MALSADYSLAQIDLVRSVLDPAFLAGVGVLALATAGAVWGWFRARHVCFGILFATLTYAVVANVIVPIGTVMAERLLYLPSAGFCLLVGLVIARLGGQGWLTIVLAAVVVGLYGARTVTRNTVWREPLAFFQTMVADAPRSARSHRELGLVLSEGGRHDEAVAELEASLRLVPDEPITLYNLGNVLSKAGRGDQALRAYEQALAQQPGLVSAYVNLGNVYSTRGDEASAAAVFRRGLGQAPDAAELHLNLANALLRQGRQAEAEAHYREAVRLAPEDPLAHLNYGALLQAAGRYGEAAAQYRVLLGLVPHNPRLHVAHVALLRAAGRELEARAALADAEKRFPADADVRRMREVVGR